MTQYYFYFNQDRCIGCNTCVAACKNWNCEHRGDKTINAAPADYEKEYMLADGATEKGEYFINTGTEKTNYELYRRHNMKEDWRRLEPHETGSVSMNVKGTFEISYDRRFLTIGCNHCEDPACVRACPMGVIVKEQEHGAVLVSNETCISCGRCHEACPWGAPQFYDPAYRSYPLGDARRPKMTKCTMCLDRVKAGLKPACVAACLNRALDLCRLTELNERHNEGLTDTLPEFKSDWVEVLGINTKPNIRFKKKS